MPYIQSRDTRLERLTFAERVYPESVGELNWAITTLVKNYLQRATRIEKESYEDYNAAIGALECAKLELARRRLAIYEDEKRQEAGRVDPYDD
jgi:hypothetical protein